MKKLLLTGSYSTGETAASFRSFWFDERTGTLTPAQGIHLRNPSFAAVHGNVLYIVGEELEKGRLEAYRLDRSNGSMNFLSAVEFPGAATCHVLAWPGGSYVSCSNYLSGSFTVLPAMDGWLDQPIAVQQHTGQGYLCPGRQDGPHVHSTCISPDGKRLFVADLGLDWVEVFRIDAARGILVKEGPQNQIHTPKGEGPRHMTFSSDGRRLYLVTELGNKCFVYDYNCATGATSHIQTVSLLPSEFTAASKAADVHLSPDDRFLYTSNRGADTLAVFSVDSCTGQLTLIQQAFTHGNFPRSFCVCEHWVIIANRHSGNIAVCQRNPQTGLVGEISHLESLEQAAFVKLIN